MVLGLKGFNYYKINMKFQMMKFLEDLLLLLIDFFFDKMQFNLYYSLKPAFYDDGE